LDHIRSMTYEVSIKRTAYDYLKVSAHSIQSDPQEIPFVAIHLDRSSFVKSLNLARLDMSYRQKLLQACTRAWTIKGLEVLCAPIELSPDQRSHLRLVPHTFNRSAPLTQPQRSRGQSMTPTEAAIG
jgi:hypothetical protein